MKKPLIQVVFFLVILMVMLSGCSTGQNSQQSAAPTVSGYVSVGADKNLNH